MKYILIVIIILFIMNCNSSQNDLNKIWIGQNQIDYHYNIDSLECYSETEIRLKRGHKIDQDSNFICISKSINKNIMKFDRDSFTDILFNPIFKEGNWRDTRHYKLISDTIYVSGETDLPKINVMKVDNRKLLLSYYQENGYHFDQYFYKAELYRQNNYKRELIMLFSNYRFNSNEYNGEIQFSPIDSFGQGEILIDNKTPDYFYKNKWNITSLDEELFLIIDQIIYQIKSVNERRIVCLKFYPKLEETEFVAVDKKSMN